MLYLQKDSGEIKMPTFYDPIELEDVDIKDNAARFYIVHSGGVSTNFAQQHRI